jgi:hypothetical protein
MEEELDNFNYNEPKEKKKKPLIERLIALILKKESKSEDENLRILRFIRPPRYKPKPLGQIVSTTGIRPPQSALSNSKTIGHIFQNHDLALAGTFGKYRVFINEGTNIFAYILV